MPKYLIDLVDRAVRTAAQTAVAMIGADAFDVLTADWQGIASVATGAAVVSALTTVAARGVLGRNAASEGDADA